MSSNVHKIKSVNSNSISKILKDKKKRIRLFFLVTGLMLLTAGFYFSADSSKITVNNTSSTGVSANEVVSFSQEPINVDKALLGSTPAKQKTKSPPLRIVVPDLKMDISVKEAKVVKGYWEVFPDSAGFGLGSAYPDEIGNQVIFAHARKGLFLPLKEAKVGDSVYIFTKDQYYYYRIREIKEVLPQQTEVIAPTSDQTLTLYTCSGYADSKRLIIISKRV